MGPARVQHSADAARLHGTQTTLVTDRQKGDPLGLRDAARLAKISWHLGEGNKASSQGRRQDAIDHYTRALDLANSPSLLGERLGARHNLATEYIEDGKFSLAGLQLESLITESRKQNQVSVLGKPVLTWALRTDAVKLQLFIALESRDLDRVRGLVDALLNESPGPKARGEAHQIAGEMLAAQGELSDAADKYAASASEFAAIGAVEDRARAAWGAAVLFLRANWLDAASDWAMAAQESFELCGESALVADCMYLRGDLSARRHDRATAGVLYQDAGRHYEVCGNTTQLINVRMAAHRLMWLEPDEVGDSEGKPASRA